MQLVIICNRSNRKRPFRSEVPSILAIDEIRRSWVQEPSAKAKFPVMLSGWPIDDTDLNGEQGCPFFPLEQHLNAQSHTGCVRGTKEPAA